MSERPIVAITMGDPAGVGPEVLARALARGEVWECCHPIVVGDAGVMREAIALVAAPLAVHVITDAAEARFAPTAPDVLDLANVDLAWQPGQVSAAAGLAAVEYIERAAQSASNRSCALTARQTWCLMQVQAQVEKAEPCAGSNPRIARHRPMRPAWRASSKGSPPRTC